MPAQSRIFGGFVLQALLAVIFSVAAGAADPDVPEAPWPWFVSRELAAIIEPHRFKTESHSVTDIGYRLFKPTISEAEAGKRFPMIVILHGAGPELDFPDLGQLNHLQSLVFREPKHPEKYPFFLLAPYLPKGSSFHIPNLSNGQEGIVALIGELQKQYPIDPDRITLMGISYGGGEAWEMAARNPDRFAAVAPIAALKIDRAGIEGLIKVPIWAFQSEGDRPEAQRAAIARLTNAGGCCRLTELPGSGHDAWTAAFREHGLLEWLLAQKRGAGCTLIDTTPWRERVVSWIGNYWPQLLTGTVLVCGVILWWRELGNRGSSELPSVFADDSKS